MEQCHEIIVFVFGEVCVIGMSMIMSVIKKKIQGRPVLLIQRG